MERFEELVRDFGEALPEVATPSDATLSLWCEVADTYDASRLEALINLVSCWIVVWESHAGAVARGVRDALRDVRSAAYLFGEQDGEIPARERVTWPEVQRAVEQLSVAWMEIGQ